MFSMGSFEFCLFSCIHDNIWINTTTYETDLEYENYKYVFWQSKTGTNENVQHYYNAIVDVIYLLISRGRRGRDHKVIACPTTCAIFFFFFRYTILLQDVEDYVLLHAWVFKKNIYINFIKWNKVKSKVWIKQNKKFKNMYNCIWNLNI